MSDGEQDAALPTQIKNEIESQKAINLKLAPFWPNNPVLWFAQAEAQFSINRVKADGLKYSYVVAALPQDTCESIVEVVTNPPEINKYEAIKTALTQRHAISEERRLEKLVEKADLGDKRPSEAFYAMKALAVGTIDDNLVKKLWIRKLPQLIYATLTAIGDKPIDELLKIADKIHESPTLNVQQISPAPSTSRGPVVANSTLEQRLANVESMLARLTTGRSRSRSPRFRSRSRSRDRRPRSGSRGRFNGKPICYFHRRFGVAARNCRFPCNFLKPGSTPTSSKND